jgi:2-dehydropantoate 2-reductase
VTHRYVVYGAGAIGGTIGARLFEGGREVVLIARGAHYEALRDHGLCFSDPERSRTLRMPAVNHPGAIEWRHDDVLVLAVKSQDTPGALRDLVAVAPDALPVVCAQNGVDNERSALRVFSRVYGMAVMMPATHIEPGAVDADSLPVVGVLDLGRYPRGTDEVAAAVAGDLNDTGFRSSPDEDIMRWKYDKLLLNLSTALRAACGPEATDDAARAEARMAIEARLLDEALACYTRASITLPTETERREHLGGGLTMRPIPGRPRVAGSGWQSLARGTGSVEADYTNGEIVLLGRLVGVATPANALLQRVANAMARSGAAPGSVAVTKLAAALPER